MLRFSIYLSVIFPGLSYRHMYRKFKKVVLCLLAHVMPSNFFRRILRSEALVYKSYLFQFYGNYSTLDSHTITVISHAFVYLSRWRRKLWQGLLYSCMLLGLGMLTICHVSPYSRFDHWLARKKCIMLHSVYDLFPTSHS